MLRCFPVLAERADVRAEISSLLPVVSFSGFHLILNDSRMSGSLLRFSCALNPVSSWSESIIGGDCRLMIRFEHVSKIYDDKVMAVDDVNLEIVRGEFVVLIGPAAVVRLLLWR